MLGFFDTNFSVGAKPPKTVQLLFQILNPVTDTEILDPELVGNQSELVVQQFFHTFSY